MAGVNRLSGGKQAVWLLCKGCTGTQHRIWSVESGDDAYPVLNDVEG